MSTADRDPIDPQALAAAVGAYRWNSDEADIALEAVLLEQGVISPSEAIEQIELVVSDQLIGLFIRLDTDEMFTVDREGAVETYER